MYYQRQRNPSIVSFITGPSTFDSINDKKNKTNQKILFKANKDSDYEINQNTNIYPSEHRFDYSENFDSNDSYQNKCNTKQINEENENLKNCIQQLEEQKKRLESDIIKFKADSEEMKNIISCLKDQNYLNEYDSTQSIAQIIKQIIYDKDCEIASINQKNKEIIDFDNKLKAAYNEKDYTEQYIRKTICQKLSINSKRTKLSQLFDYFISNYKNSSEDQNPKKNLDEIKSFLIEQGIAESDQDKPEIVLIKQIVKEKNLKIKELVIERKKMRQLIIDWSKEKEEVNQYLINEGVIQMNDKINYKNIISSIISEKEQLIKQVDSLRSTNESLKKKVSIKDDKMNSKELISSIQEKNAKLHNDMEKMIQNSLEMNILIEKLQKQYNQSQANENEDSESENDHFELS